MQYSVNAREEAFIQEFEPLIAALESIQLQTIYNTLRASVSRNPDAIAVHLLNVRHALAGLSLAGHPGNTEEAEELLEQLQMQQSIPWNTLLKMILVAVAS